MNTLSTKVTEACFKLPSLLLNSTSFSNFLHLQWLVSFTLVRFSLETQKKKRQEAYLSIVAVVRYGLLKWLLVEK